MARRQDQRESSDACELLEKTVVGTNVKRANTDENCETMRKHSRLIQTECHKACTVNINTPERSRDNGTCHGQCQPNELEHVCRGQNKSSVAMPTE